jgi:CRISPR system Cascade subunit CasB
MFSTETLVVASGESQEGAVPQPKVSLRYQVSAIDKFLKDAKEGIKASKSDYIALKRLDPSADRLTVAQIAALTNLAQRAMFDLDRLKLDHWRRWAFIAHGIALSGHDAGEGKYLGRQLHDAGVSEARVTRLLDARGDAFVQTLPRLLRLMASKNVAPNWAELGRLVLNEDQDDAEKTRLKVARDFFSTKAKANTKAATGR